MSHLMNIWSQLKIEKINKDWWWIRSRSFRCAWPCATLSQLLHVLKVCRCYDGACRWRLWLSLTSALALWRNFILVLPSYGFGNWPIYILFHKWRLGWNTKKSQVKFLSKGLDLIGYVEPDLNWSFFILDNRARSRIIWLRLWLMTGNDAVSGSVNMSCSNI